VTVLGTDSSGTHFYWDDAVGERHFGVISDLIGFNIVRAGAVNIEVLALSASQIGGDTGVLLSPALPGAVTDYLVFTTSDDAGTGDTPLSTGFLNDLSDLHVRVLLGPQLIQSASATHTHAAHTAHTPTTHSSVDINVTNPHTHDSHTLTHAAHSGGGHRHDPLQGVPSAGVSADFTYRVSWMIIRA